MLNYISIMLGGALGTGARFWLSGIMSARYGDAFPFGTLLVNVSGCFLVGLVATALDPGGRFIASPSARQFFVVGVFGGYTTFSAFGLQTLELATRGDWLKAFINAGSSLVLCLLAVWLGRAIALALLPR